MTQRAKQPGPSPTEQPTSLTAALAAGQKFESELPETYEIDLEDDDLDPAGLGEEVVDQPTAPAEAAMSGEAEPPAVAKPDLSLVERSRTSLLQFLTLVVMVVLGVILFVSAQKGMGFEIPLLALVALSACLYALARERSLREEQHAMTVQLIARERQMNRMHRRISEERERSEVLWNRLDEITSLYRAISAIKAADNPAEALHTVVRAACDLVAADCGSLQLLDESKKMLTVEASEGVREGVLGQTQAIDEGVAGWVVRNSQVLLLEGKAHDDARFDHTFERRGVAVQSSMAVPLTWNGETFGVLNVGLAEGGEKLNFAEHDQRLVRIFAEHATLLVVSTRGLGPREG
jgi:uncharacterized protein YigA (DUF484 family)